MNPLTKKGDKAIRHPLTLKVSMGGPPKGTHPPDQGLKDFDQIEQPRLDEIFFKEAEALNLMFLEGLQTVMNRYQKKVRTEA